MFGKKATSSDATAPASKSGDASGKKLASPYQFLAIALISVLLGITAGSVLLRQGVVDPATRDFQQAAQKAKAEDAAAFVSRTLKQVDLEVNNLSSLAMLGDAITDPLARRRMEVSLTAFFPHAERVILTPLGEAAPDTATPVPLSFAGLDLLRRAETGQALAAEAFILNERWYVQKAQAVRDGQSNEILGTLLVIFNQKLLTDVLSEFPGQGNLAVVQAIGGQSKTIASRGGDPGAAAIEMPVSVPNWSLRYSDAGGVGLINQNGVWIAMGLALFIGMVGVALAHGLLLKTLRKDLMLLTAYLQGSLLGERPKVPALRMNFFQPIATVMAQHLRNFIKRPDKPAPEPEPESKPVTPAAESDSFADPLFQNSDVLDINMMDGDEDLLGLNESLGGEPTASMEVKTPVKAAPGQGVSVPSEIFRAYDIRGLVGRTLTEDIVYLIGRAIGSEASERGLSTLCVGYDGRESSPVLAGALTRGILEAGIDVVSIGMVPTPVLYFSTYHLNTGSGVMVTGSHNPSEYNGLKMMLGGVTLASDEIQALYRRIREGRFVFGQGQPSEMDVRRDYLDTIINDIAVAAPLKVVVDAGNGVAGELGPMLIQELGCEVIPMYCEVDGRFPNHHPDPGKPENLRDLIARVREEGADLGIAFDGDGDRLGVVTNEGKIIWPDRLLMLFAKDVVSRNPGADVIFDVKCTRRLNALISGYGGRPIMWKSGHSLIKAKMKETGALLAGEMSGHIFFKERWYGFDDGIYSAARLLEILGVDERSCHNMFAAFPDDISTPEINIEVTEESKFKIVERLMQTGNFGDGNLSTIDGVRVDYPSGWGLCRASNTTPMLVLRFEAESQESLEQIQGIFRTQLQAVDNKLFIPF